MNGGKLMRAVGMAGKGWQANKSPLNRHCRQTQPADSLPGTGLKPNSQQLAGFAAKTQQLPDDVVLPSVQLGGGECSRAGSQKGGCRPA